jgi:hypothetical protein
VLLLLALLLLELLFDLELDALFFDPLELPDLVGMALSFRRRKPSSRRTSSFVGSATQAMFPYCSA